MFQYEWSIVIIGCTKGCALHRCGWSDGTWCTSDNKCHGYYLSPEPLRVLSQKVPRHSRSHCGRYWRDQRSRRLCLTGRGQIWLGGLTGSGRIWLGFHCSRSVGYLFPMTGTTADAHDDSGPDQNIGIDERVRCDVMWGDDRVWCSVMTDCVSVVWCYERVCAVLFYDVLYCTVLWCNMMSREVMIGCNMMNQYLHEFQHEGGDVDACGRKREVPTRVIGD